MLLVTGGAGFIGSNIIVALNDAGRADVAVCDFLGSDGKWRNLAKRQLADVVPPAELMSWLNGRRLDAVIHMGAISETTATDGDLVIETNFRLSMRRLQAPERPVQDERARRSPRGAGSGRSGCHLRTGYAARSDYPDQAERSGEGRRLPPRAGDRPRGRRGERRFRRIGRYPAGARHHVAGPARAREPGMIADASGGGARVFARKPLSGPTGGCIAAVLPAGGAL